MSNHPHSDKGGLKTLAAPAHHESLVRKSRFVARAVALEGEQAAARYLKELPVAAASHNCWAWRYGAICRFSDDGEPGGTAGRPILAAIDNLGFDRCLVLVTRWYGGIQLGTGGLARAYGGAATACLQAAVSRELVERVGLQGFCPYPVLEQFKALLTAAAATIEQEHFQANGVELRLAVPAQQQAGLHASFNNLSRGEGRLVPWPEYDTPCKGPSQA